MSKAEKIFGEITFISISPHGHPEGIVIDKKVFIKIPPHTLVAKELFKKGASVEVEAEKVDTEFFPSYNHARVVVGKELAADDRVGPKESEKLKVAHKKENETRSKAKSEKATVTSKIVALGVKKHGEVDRILLQDGTSIHIPKELKLQGGDLEIGSEVTVSGELKKFKNGKFLKADTLPQ